MLLHTLCMPCRPCSRHATAEVCVQHHPHLLHPAKPLSIQCLSVPELSNNATINTSDAMAATQPAVCMMRGHVRKMHAQKSAHTTHCTCNNHIITINPSASFVGKIARALSLLLHQLQRHWQAATRQTTQQPRGSLQVPPGRTPIPGAWRRAAVAFVVSHS